jgi:hypothetical protein
MHTPSKPTDREREAWKQLAEIGYEPMDISKLASELAGLPPMMEVYCNADGEAMFIHELRVERGPDDTQPPFARIVCGPKPPIVEAPKLTPEEAEAMQRQRAMQLSHATEQAQRMPSMEP